jgi:uncharacterized protein YabE (DUF348 family)
VSLRTLVQRPTALVLQASVLTALVGGTAAWTMTTKTVALSVDGHVRQVHTHGGTVRDVLASAGLRAGGHDLLAPAADADIADGDRIALRRGRQLQLVVDGVERTVWVTAASVDEALAQIGVRNDAFVSASRSREIPLSGLELQVRLPKTVAVAVDGKVKVVTSTAATVGEGLRQAGIPLQPADRVAPARETVLRDRLTVRVTRVVARQVVESAAVPYATVRRPDSRMFTGDTKVLTPGRLGVVVRTYAVNLVDGRVVSKVLVSEVRKSAPVTRVLAVGTKARPAGRRSSSTGTSADGLNWAALARCESGGNPRAVSSSGAYRGLYQFSMSTWRGVGGTGDPIDASPAEQTYRAKILYSRSGRSPWPVCGKYL